jgi:2'-5' RNA ligase
MRMFVALQPPVAAVEHLDEFLEVRRAAAAFRWSPPEQFHVTLAFLPDVPEHVLDNLLERLTRAAARRTPFQTALVGGGAFPNAARARVIWAGLDLGDASATELARLASGARAAANQAGAAVGGQRFRPHVTVARIDRAQGVVSWVRLLDTYRGPGWRADRIALVASHLGEGPRGRPRYETVEKFALEG